MAAVILIILALISVNMVLLLISGWILAYAGIFFLGFGGSRWTSEIAINYYRTVLGVAISLFAMVLLVGIGKTFLDDYYSQMSGGLNLKEMGVLMVVSIVLLVLVNKIPPMLSAIVGGGAGGIGNLGAGAAVATAATAAGVATGMMMASAAHAAGGASAIKAAFDAAHGSMEGGMGLFADRGGEQGKSSSGGGLGTDGGYRSAFCRRNGLPSEPWRKRRGENGSCLARRTCSPNPRRKSRRCHPRQLAGTKIQGQRFRQFDGNQA